MNSTESSWWNTTNDYFNESGSIDMSAVLSRLDASDFSSDSDDFDLDDSDDSDDSDDESTKRRVQDFEGSNTYMELRACGMFQNEDVWSVYQSKGEIGRGTFGVVYLAQKRGTKVSKKVAVKAVSSVRLALPSLMKSREMESYEMRGINAVFREIEAHMRCKQHRNLVELHDVFCFQGPEEPNSLWNPNQDSNPIPQP